MSQFAPALRASVQERFCKTAKATVLIVELCNELVVAAKSRLGCPLRMASK